LRAASKYVCSVPDPDGGTYSAPPDPLAGFGEGREVKRRGGRTEGRRREERGGEGKGRTPEQKSWLRP